MQSGERQFHLRLHTRRPDHPAPPGAPGQVVEQRRLAHTRITAHYQGLALTRPHTSHEPVQHATFSVPVYQPLPATRTSSGRHYRPSATWRPGRQYHPTVR
jgi:hypothetical protein